MAPHTRPLRAVVCDDDPMTLSVLAHALADAGYEVLDRLDNGPRLLTSIETEHPSLAVLVNELPGMLGHEVVETIGRLGLDDPPETLLVTADPSIRQRAIEGGAWAVIPVGDPDALAAAIADVTHYLRTGERRSSSDRRGGGDRRVKQDWSKVTHERRSGGDRRRGDRRSGEEGDDTDLDAIDSLADWEFGHAEGNDPPSE